MPLKLLRLMPMTTLPLLLPPRRKAPPTLPLPLALLRLRGQAQQTLLMSRRHQLLPLRAADAHTRPKKQGGRARGKSSEPLSHLQEKHTWLTSKGRNADGQLVVGCSTCTEYYGDHSMPGVKKTSFAKGTAAWRDSSTAKHHAESEMHKDRLSNRMGIKVLDSKMRVRMLMVSKAKDCQVWL